MPYLQINPHYFVDNLQVIKSIIGEDEGHKIAIVLKDNAYGHGLVELAKISSEAGITSCFVKNTQEAIEVAKWFEHISILYPQSLENETLLSYQNDGDQVEITVTSNLQNRARRMQDCICKDTAAQEQNVHCLENHEEVEEAHEHGLSFGKYRAFLELQQLDPNITVDDVMDMSMCEIQDLIRGNGGNGSREDGQHNAHGEGHGGRHGSHE